MTNEIFAIVSPNGGYYKIKRNKTLELVIWGINDGNYFLIDSTQLKYTMPKDHENIISVTKDGIVTAIGKRGEVGRIKVSLKNKLECYCVIYVEVV